MAGPVEVEGVVAGRAELAGGQHLLTLSAGDVARLGAPGQFAMLRCADRYDPYLRRALPFLRLAGETVSFLFQAADPGLSWLARRGLGHRVSLSGPLGRGFDLRPGTRHLLLAAEAGPVAPLLALGDLALARGASVSLVLNPAVAAGLAGIIPQTVEVIPGAAGAVWEMAARNLAWADQAALAGVEEELVRLARAIAAPAPGLVQCYLRAPMGCGLGWCGSCLAETRRGPRRACVGGPVFDLRELI